MNDCAHMNFAADVKVARVEEKEGGPIIAFMADITVKCSDCGLPFRWVGPYDLGMSYDKPMLGVDRQELRAPIEPDVLESIERMRPPGQPTGFSIVSRGPEVKGQVS